jgi:uncharacterized protein (TIGR02147 family)
MTNQDLATYQDYRKFLWDHVNAKKAINPKWSFGMWARTLGLKATSSITMILNGQREAGPQITAKLVHYFGFNETEAQYFRELIKVSKAKKDPYLRKLLETNNGFVKMGVFELSS